MALTRERQAKIAWLFHCSAPRPVNRIVMRLLLRENRHWLRGNLKR